VSSSEVQANGGSFGSAPLSDGGRYIVFRSDASNLVTGDTNGIADIFVRDRTAGTTTRVNLDHTGAEVTGFASTTPNISRNGRYISFQTAAALVPSDGNAVSDIYVVDRNPDGNDNFTDTTSYIVRASVDSSYGDPNALSLTGTLGATTVIAFGSDATDLVTGDGNGQRDAFFRDLDFDNDTILDPEDNCETVERR
jgi:hypothetical protein